MTAASLRVAASSTGEDGAAIAGVACSTGEDGAAIARVVLSMSGGSSVV